MIKNPGRAARVETNGAGWWVKVLPDGPKSRVTNRGEAEAWARNWRRFGAFYKSGPPQ